MSLLTRLNALPQNGRTVVYQTVYGSKLYGCDLPGSDHDIRGVYIPSLSDLLLGRFQNTATLPHDPALGESDDVVFFSDVNFVHQVLGMKCNCVEIYFAAHQARLNGETLHPAMTFLLDQKHRMITADPHGFIGHARQRARSHMEGDDPQDTTLQANKHVLAVLAKAMESDPVRPAMPLEAVPGLVDALCEHERVRVDKNKHNEEVLFVHTRQAHLTMTLAALHQTVQQRVERFTSKRSGVTDRQRDKDLSTALRMVETAANLMETGTIVFPIANADFHRNIRRGLVDPQTVFGLIDEAQHRAEDAVASGRSPLPAPYKEGDSAAVRDDIVVELRGLMLDDIVRQKT